MSIGFPGDLLFVPPAGAVGADGPPGARARIRLDGHAAAALKSVLSTAACCRRRTSSPTRRRWPRRRRCSGSASSMSVFSFCDPPVRRAEVQRFLRARLPVEPAGGVMFEIVSPIHIVAERRAPVGSLFCRPSSVDVAVRESKDIHAVPYHRLGLSRSGSSLSLLFT